AAVGAVALGLVVLAGAGAAWRLELVPAALQIDWTRVESIMSPRASTAEAAPGPTVALVAAEGPTTDDAETGAEPVVFPNSAAPAEAPAPQLAAAPAEAPAAAPPPPEVAAPQPTEPAPPAPAAAESRADAPPPA